MTDIPKWLLEQQGLTTRQWKARKRTELKAVIKALNVYEIGCFYTPDKNGEIERRIGTDLKSLQQALSVKNWGK